MLFVFVQMRLHFFFNAKRLRPSEMLEMQRMVRSCCPVALTDLNTGDVKVKSWTLHHIAITNSVWCMAYKGGVGLGAYLAQKSCNSIAMG